MDLLAAFGRGALGTLTDRFGQYDAAVESVARHEQTLDKHLQVLNSINEAKVEWFVISITAAVYEDILSGVKDYITIPYDISTLIEGDSQLKSGQAGIKLEVAGEASVNAVYLPFTLVSQAYILPSFDDLVIRGTSLSSGKAYDTRYHVNVDAETNYIKLEKVKESASAELPWLDLSPADDEELNNFINAFALAGQTGEAQEYALTAHEAVDITKYRGIVIDIASEGIHFKTPFVVSDGTYRICAETFTADSEYVLACKCADSKLWLTLTNISSRDMFQYQSTFAKTSDLSDYAKKTDIPQQPMVLLVCGDNGNTTDMNGDTFTLTPTKLTNGSVDYFAVELTDQMASRLNALFGELNKAQDPHGSDVYVADTNPVNMLPTLMLTFYDGSIAYRFDAVESSPGNMAFVFKGEIPVGFGGFATWVAFALVQPGMSQLEFRLIK